MLQVKLQIEIAPPLNSVHYTILYLVRVCIFYALSTSQRVDTLFESPEKAAGVADDKGMSLAARAKNIISSCKTNEDDDSSWLSLALLFPFPSFRGLQSLSSRIIVRFETRLAS